jgi:hypothetical protein
VFNGSSLSERGPVDLSWWCLSRMRRQRVTRSPHRWGGMSRTVTAWTRWPGLWNTARTRAVFLPKPGVGLWLAKLRISGNYRAMNNEFTWILSWRGMELARFEQEMPPTPRQVFDLLPEIQARGVANAEIMDRQIHEIPIPPDRPLHSLIFITALSVIAFAVVVATGVWLYHITPSEAECPGHVCEVRP